MHSGYIRINKKTKFQSSARKKFLFNKVSRENNKYYFFFYYLNYYWIWVILQEYKTQFSTAAKFWKLVNIF